MSYENVTRQLAAELSNRCEGPLSIVVIDGIPAGGKSSLTARLQDALVDLGREAVTVENDWFIARSIRNPLAVALGLTLALSPKSVDEVERRLLAKFLDGGRLGAFQDELERARDQLAEAEEVVVRPRGAFWNLHRPRPWSAVAASEGLLLRRRGIVLIEGTLTAATYGPRFRDLTRVFVNVPPAVARERFLERNQNESRRRNFAFSALARNSQAFHLAARMLSRHRDQYDFEVDLTEFDGPVLHGGRDD